MYDPTNERIKRRLNGVELARAYSARGGRAAPGAGAAGDAARDRTPRLRVRRPRPRRRDVPRPRLRAAADRARGGVRRSTGRGRAGGRAARRVGGVPDALRHHLGPGRAATRGGRRRRWPSRGRAPASRSTASPTTVEWLSLTGQAVLEVTGGPVFRDDTGELTRHPRTARAGTPTTSGATSIAADWTRIGEELQFVGRAGERGDDAGSRILAARLARTAMHLGFLLARRWPPYSKWLGTAFADAARARPTSPPRSTAPWRPSDWREREAGLVAALDALAGEAGDGAVLRPALPRACRSLAEPLLAVDQRSAAARARADRIGRAVVRQRRSADGRRPAARRHPRAVRPDDAAYLGGIRMPPSTRTVAPFM